MSRSADALQRSNMEDVRRIIQEMDAPKKRTISAAAYLSVKHALPNTCVGHTIIHENPCQVMSKLKTKINFLLLMEKEHNFCINYD